MNRADIWEAVKDVPFTEGLCTLHFFTPLSPKKVSSLRYKLKLVQAYAPISNNKNEAVYTRMSNHVQRGLRWA